MSRLTQNPPQRENVIMARGGNVKRSCLLTIDLRIMNVKQLLLPTLSQRSHRMTALHALCRTVARTPNPLVERRDKPQQRERIAQHALAMAAFIAFRRYAPRPSAVSTDGFVTYLYSCRGRCPLRPQSSDEQGQGDQKTKQQTHKFCQMQRKCGIGVKVANLSDKSQIAQL